MARIWRQMALGATATLALSGTASGETLYDAMRDAYYYNPSIEAARDSLRALGENVPIAESGRLPTLAFVAQQQFQNTIYNPAPRQDASERPLTFGLEGSLPLYDGGASPNQVSQARADVEAAYSRLNDQEQDTLLSAVNVFFDVLRDKEIRDLSVRNLAVLRQELQASEIRFEVGEATITDVAQAKARVAEANANLIQSEGALRSSAARYRGVVGRLPTRLSPPQRLPTLPPSLASSETIALANHPSIRAARSAERAALYAIRVAMAGNLPTVDLNASLQGSLSDGIVGDTFFSSDDDERRTATAGLTLSLNAPIYQGGRVDAQVRQARFTASQRRSEYHQAVREVRQDLNTAWQTLITAKGAISSNVERVRAAQIAFQGLREELRVGSRSTIDVLDAEEDLLAARIALVQSVRDLNVAAYTVLAEMGRFDPETFGLDDTVGAQLQRPVYARGPVYGYPDDTTTAWRFPWRP